jgi:hypothetical protein
MSTTPGIRTWNQFIEILTVFDALKLILLPVSEIARGIFVGAIRHTASIDTPKLAFVVTKTSDRHIVGVNFCGAVHAASVSAPHTR